MGLLQMFSWATKWQKQIVRINFFIVQNLELIPFIKRDIICSSDSASHKYESRAIVLQVVIT